MTSEADGVLEQRGGKDVIRFERRLAHPPEGVWAAITEPGELIAWWGDADVDLVEGGRFRMSWLNTDDEGNRAVMDATISELDPPRVLELDGDLHGTLRFELTPDGEGTRLEFTSTLELPEEFRTKVLAGWHWHLGALADALDGGRADLVELPGWDRVHERYAARVG
ncbi:MAG TPA: SRPBCC family protein [Thermoleophilaceae bacterium]|jgi:uncharacterized protein YndB with AHSA1/START domain